MLILPPVVVGSPTISTGLHQVGKSWQKEINGTVKGESEERDQVESPKSSKGKARSAQNATKDGVFSRKIVIPQLDVPRIGGVNFIARE